MTKPARSEHSQTTASAISSGLPIRPIGTRAMIVFAAAAHGVLGHRRLDIAGADRVDADIRPAHGRSPPPWSARPRHACWRHRRSSVRQPDQPDDRGGIDDGAAALLPHLRHLMPQAAPDAGEVHRRAGRSGGFLQVARSACPAASTCSGAMPALLKAQSSPPKAPTAAATIAATCGVIGDVHGDRHRLAARAPRSPRRSSARASRLRSAAATQALRARRPAPRRGRCRKRRR